VQSFALVAVAVGDDGRVRAAHWQPMVRTRSRREGGARMDRPVHVLVISDREITREGLTRLLCESGFEAWNHPVGAEAADLLLAPFALHDWMDDDDHLVIVDISPGAKLVAACHLLRKSFPRTRIVAIGDDQEVDLVKASFAAGVDGFCARMVQYAPLVLMLRLVMLGQKVVPSGILEDVLRNESSLGNIDLTRALEEVQLSERETHILRCLVDGDANKIIARKLGIAEATVKAHIKGILRKLNVLNRTQAAVWLINRKMANGSSSPNPTLQ
jgi:two-component system, NarL family, nitrate/nitrite response regulator NarL